MDCLLSQAERSVRAGMVDDPAKYRWSSYGEAVGGGAKGNGKKAREGWVRACLCQEGAGFEAERWQEVSRIYRRAMGLALGRKSGRAEVDQRRRSQTAATVAEALAAKDNGTVLPDLGMAAMLLHRVRYLARFPCGAHSDVAAAAAWTSSTISPLAGWL